MIGEAKKRREGAVRVARVLRRYEQDKILLYDVQDSYGAHFRGCRLMVQIGTAETFVHASPAASSEDTTKGSPKISVEDTLKGSLAALGNLGLGIFTAGGNKSPSASSALKAGGAALQTGLLEGSEVVIALTEGAQPTAIILGAIATPQTFKRFDSNTKSPDRHEDDAATNHPDDIVIENQGSRIAATRNGGVLLDTRSSGEPIRAQLDAQSAFRISQDGDADEHVPLAGPTRAKFDEMIVKMNEMAVKLKTITDAIQTASQVLATAPQMDATAQAFFTAVLGTPAAPGVQTDIATYDHAADVDVTDDSLVAHAVEVSSRSVAEAEPESEGDEDGTESA